ncbi:dienelactone hydrolase family protein [Sneathiella marina]|uniref:Dienelactone hydrolase family protein n=1 Tax=Sneathiella marina TaxID=2950108 RepID=A0ABY4W9Z9_9PROT|nr:dienelactone hydrolase family protein [Sneathiella marina]USG62104.1 dienelactone hydrolase family protein [Sneathiella marina]
MFARRDIVKGAATLPLAAILADPILAQAAAAGMQDVTLKLKNGKPIKASVAMPDVTPAPSVLLIHEWWGLNDQIKAVAAEFAKAGYVAVAVDLYDQKVGTTPDEAKSLMGSVKGEEATETLTTWTDWARSNDKTTDKIGTIGWCFGGGWSLNASIARPVDATIVYYGNVAKKADQLKNLKGPVMGHFAEKDQWINKAMVDGFVAQMKVAGEPDPEVFWYDAEHAFANPSGGRYDKADAQLAWKRSMDFFDKNLKG